MQYLYLPFLLFALSFPTFACGRDQETSLLVSTKVEHIPTVPCATAELAEWEEYISRLWNNEQSSCLVGLLAVDGTRIDLTTSTWRRSCPECKCHCVWEVKRSHDWQTAIGRVAKVKGITKTAQAGIVLLVQDFSKEKIDLLNAEIACKALELRFQTVDISGVIR